jgi:heme/copper-type cytochrome/quinol oxidase subunit 2
MGGLPHGNGVPCLTVEGLQEKIYFKAEGIPSVTTFEWTQLKWTDNAGDSAKTKTALIVSLCVVFGLIFIGLVVLGVFCFIRRRKKSKDSAPYVQSVKRV